MLTDVHQLVVTFEALNGNKNMFVYSFMHSLLCLVYGFSFSLIPIRKITHTPHIVLTKCIVVLTQFIKFKEIF